MLHTPFPEQMPVRYNQRKAFMKFLPHIKAKYRPWYTALPYTRSNKQKKLPPASAEIDDSFLSQYDIFLLESVRKEIKDADPGIKSRDFDIDAETSDLGELEVTDWFNAAEEWSAASSYEYPESQESESKDPESQDSSKDQETQDSAPKEMEQSE